MKILIPNATSPKNIGDLAILTGLISLLGKNNKIKVHSTEPQLYNREFDKFKVSHTLYSWAVFKNRNVISRVKNIGELLINYGLLKFGFNTPKIGKSSLILKDYLNADVILFVGGGYLRSQKGIKQSLNLLMTLLHFYIAKKTKAKKIVAPISFGPFAYKWQEKYAAGVLKEFDIVATRERYSYNLLKKYKLANLISSSDSSFFLNVKKENRDLQRRNVVLGFTIREWLREKLQKNFEAEFTDAIAMFAKTTGVQIRPIVQVDAPKYGDNDADLTKKIAIDLKGKGVKVLPIKKIVDLKSAFKVYGELDLLLGMRMHSNILAAIQGTPFVAISYEHKTEGITRQLVMEKYCVKCEKVNKENLYKLLVDVYTNKIDLKNKLISSVKTIQVNETQKWNKFLSQNQ